MTSSYRDPTALDQGQRVVWQPIPAPIASYRPAIPDFLTSPKFWVIAAASFTTFGLSGGVWLGLKLADVRIAAAENRASDAQQARQQAENRLSAQLEQTAKFCQSALSTQPPPSTPSAAQPSGTVASNPHL